MNDVVLDCLTIAVCNNDKEESQSRLHHKVSILLYEANVEQGNVAVESFKHEPATGQRDMMDPTLGC